MTLMDGMQLGSCRIIRHLSSGGMGDVYLAEQADLGRQVAVKVLRDNEGKQPNEDGRTPIIESFTREARSIAALEHPNILPIYEFGEQAGIYYLVMQYVPDGSLADLMAARSAYAIFHVPASPVIVLPIISAAAAALQFAHDKHIMHLDVKPHNLLMKMLARENSVPSLTTPFHVFLSDFGLAHLMTWRSQQSGVTGTPLYSAPEQYQRRPAPASDQYALACVAFQLLTGVPPFQGGIAELHHQHLMVPAPLITTRNPALPPSLNKIFATALAKEPDQRFPSVEAFAQVLQQAFVTASQPSPFGMSSPGMPMQPSAMVPTPSPYPYQGMGGPSTGSLPAMPQMPGMSPMPQMPGVQPQMPRMPGGQPMPQMPMMPGAPPMPPMRGIPPVQFSDEPAVPLQRRSRPMITKVQVWGPLAALGLGLLILVLVLVLPKHNANKPKTTTTPPLLLGLAWSKPLVGAAGGKPVLAGKVVYDASHDGSLYALNLADGQILWKFSTRGPLPASPGIDAIGANLYLPSSDGTLYSLTNAGTLRWSTNLKTALVTTPIVSGGIVGVGTADGHYYGINTSNGNILWTIQAKTPFATAGITANGVFYLGVSHYMEAINATTSLLVWSYSAKNTIVGAATLGNGEVLFGSDDGYFYGVDAKTGKLTWSYDTKEKLDAQPLIKGSVAYISSQSGTIFAFNVSTKALLWKYATTSAFATGPVFVGLDVVQIAPDGTLYALNPTNPPTLLAKEQLSQTVVAAPTAGDIYLFVNGGTAFEELRLRTGG